MKDEAKTAPAPRWIDEHPDRIRAIWPNDYVGMSIDGCTHFIQLVEPLRPASHAACGHPMPADWETRWREFPICGIVNCGECLDRYAASTER
jgi:hypothetical protein